MRVAFKEWAVVVDALGQGGQILILRKGGISEGQGGFTAGHPRFLLFPTLFHQQRNSVIPAAQARFDVISAGFPPADHVRIEYFCEVATSRNLESLEHARALRGLHIWRDEVVAERFDWSRRKGIHVLAVRVHRLPRILEIPVIESYRGCKSWVELEQNVAIGGSTPVLSPDEFARKLAAVNEALETAGKS